MHIDWYGHSAFRLVGREFTVVIDPFGDVSALAAGGMRFEYPAIEGVDADLLLVSHEHRDHNGVQAVRGEPMILRSTAGRLDSPIGEVVAIASEHDDSAGTQRGPNTIFVFALDKLRIAHFGDFGQRALRDEQAHAIGQIDLLFIPVGGGLTIGAAQAAEITHRLAPTWVVPMHYRTPRVNFLEPAEAFLEHMHHVTRLSETGFDTHALQPGTGPQAVVPATP